MSSQDNEYGVGDGSYQEAGELAGIIRLVDDFYDLMECVPEAKTILKMHPDDLSESRRKLAFFLSGWLGGPKLYSQHYKPIEIPAVHRHLAIGVEEVDAWIGCMQRAVDQQSYPAEFKRYLIAQLRVPAGRIRQVCSTNNG